MKSRLSSTIWTLVLLNGVSLFAVLALGFSAGKKAGDASILDFNAPSSSALLIGGAVALRIGDREFESNLLLCPIAGKKPNAA